MSTPSETIRTETSQRWSEEAADGLAEEQVGGGVGGEHADPQAGDVDALRHHANGHDPRLGAIGEAGDAARRAGVV